jgi:predicted DNA-binding transcriptional regulator YafY
MQLFDTIERVHRIHKLIQRKATGSPNEFAEKLHLGKRQLYNILEEFRDYGARIKYNRIAGTFYYDNDFEVLVKISVNSLTNQEEKTIYAGNIKNNSFSQIVIHKLSFINL